MRNEPKVFFFDGIYITEFYFSCQSFRSRDSKTISFIKNELVFCFYSNISHQKIPQLHHRIIANLNNSATYMDYYARQEKNSYFLDERHFIPYKRNRDDNAYVFLINDF